MSFEEWLIFESFQVVTQREVDIDFAVFSTELSIPLHLIYAFVIIIVSVLLAT